MSESATSPAAPAVERIEFTGTGGEYFRIWIVNLLLSILTLGIYSAWAKVRRLKYFYGSTRIAGHAFDYHGDPVVILKGRLIGVLALAAYAAIAQFAPAAGGILVLAYLVLVPWVVTRARMFQMRMTSYRGVRFEFEPDYVGAFRTLFLAPFLAALSLGLAVPWAVRLRYQWLIDNTAYGNSYFKLDVGLRPVAMAVLRTLGVALVVGLVMLGAFMLLAPAVGALLGPQDMVGQTFFLISILLYVPFLFGSYVIYAYWRRSVLNVMLPATRVGPLQLHGALSARKLAWVYVTNIVGIVVTLGLFTPWARVRAARALLEATGFRAEGPFDGFIASETERTTAVGEEVGEIFDVGVGL
ncbi:MAG: YjgN family protein [Gammaproteobacteria bacterium]